MWHVICLRSGMKLKNRIKNYYDQLAEVERLNANNKADDMFFTVAPIDAKNRNSFKEDMKAIGFYKSVLYKMKSFFDETAIFCVRVIFYNKITKLIFKRRD